VNKRLQLILALTALGVVSVLLVILLIAIINQNGESGEPLNTQAVWAPEERERPTDPWINLEQEAQQRVWLRPAYSAPDAQRATLRQIVETGFFQETFSNLRWAAIERIGWQAFQLDGSVYEVRFVLRDVDIEFGPAWIVQLDRDGLQPPNSGGVVAANLFAEVLERGVTGELDRYINREAEVVEALTNHAFEGGARLASALLLHLKSRAQTEDITSVGGWTVVPERIVPGEVNLYRAFFQWREGERLLSAQWEVNLDNRAFRGLNLVASDVMAAGDSIHAEALENLRPESLDRTRPNRRQQNAFRALRAIAGNERLIEAISSVLWFENANGKSIEYRIARDNGEARLTWGAAPIEGQSGSYRVSFDYLENSERVSLSWDVTGDDVAPGSQITEFAHLALNYGAVPTTAQDVEAPPADE